MYVTQVAANDNRKYRFYIYAWQYPDGRTFYVGKGQGGRDETLKRNRLFDNVVAKIGREGDEPKIVRWHDGLREQDAFRLEVAYIKLFGRRDLKTGILCNMTNGGEGGSGRIVTKETRAKLGSWERTQSTRAKISDALSGVPKSPTHIAKRVASLIGRPLGAEHRAKIGDALRGVPKSPEAIAKTANANRGKKRSASAKAKMRAAKMGKRLSDAHRAKLASALRLAKPRSGFKGVSFDKGRSKWAAQIKIDGKTLHLGRFNTDEEAACAYDRAAFTAWRDACYINFPNQINRIAA